MANVPAAMLSTDCTVSQEVAEHSQTKEVAYLIFFLLHSLSSEKEQKYSISASISSIQNFSFSHDINNRKNKTQWKINLVKISVGLLEKLMFS